MRVFAFVERHNVQDITSIVEAQEKIARLRQTSEIYKREIPTILQEIVELQSIIATECTHPTISKKSKYTVDWNECTLCGRRFLIN